MALRDPKWLGETLSRSLSFCRDAEHHHPPHLSRVSAMKHHTTLVVMLALVVIGSCLNVEFLGGKFCMTYPSPDRQHLDAQISFSISPVDSAKEAGTRDHVLGQ